MKSRSSETEQKLQEKRKLPFLFGAVVVTAVAVTTATYAWFAMSRTPIVSDLTLNVVTESRMEIAPDVNGKPGEWDAVLDLSESQKNTTSLRTVTWSNKSNAFYAAEYGPDGRISSLNKALTDAKNATILPNGPKASDEYYMAVKFWIRASSTAAIGLSEAKEVDDGRAGSGTYVIGNPVWNGSVKKHENGGHGLETAVRLGFKCQTTDLNGNPQGGSNFIVYEPNCDTHVDGSKGYTETTNKDHGKGLVPESNLIRQTTSRWNETTPVLKSDVVYELGQFETDTQLFEVSPETMQQVTLYVWLEGQDVDCVNAAAGYETSILANVQLKVLDEKMSTGITRD